MNKWKWGVIVALILIAAFAGCKYGQRTILKQTKADTTIKRNTASLIYIPVPYKVAGDTIRYEVEGKTVYDTVDKITYVQDPTILYLPKETDDKVAAALNDFYATRFYDTLITKNGDSIQITDVVKENKIQSRKIKASWKDSVFKSTTILKQPKKTIGYFTLSGMSDIKTIDGIGIGFALKNRSDLIYSFEYKRLFGVLPKPTYEFQLMLPIRLTNKK